MATAKVGDVPVFYLEPTPEALAASGGRRRLIIWLPGFSGTKESVLPRLEDLAADGFTALSFDMAQHGERLVDADGARPATSPPLPLFPRPSFHFPPCAAETFVLRVRSNLRKYFWEILAQSAEEIPSLIDWAIETLGCEPLVGVGGQSAGGDTALAAAGAPLWLPSVGAERLKWVRRVYGNVQGWTRGSACA